MKGKADEPALYTQRKGDSDRVESKSQITGTKLCFFPKQHNVFEFVAFSLTPVFEETRSLTVDAPKLETLCISASVFWLCCGNF